MKKTFAIILLAITTAVFITSCKKTCPDGRQISNSGQCDTIPGNTGTSLTGSWSKPGPAGSGINFEIIINDATQTTQIGYNTGSAGSFTATGTGSYTRTSSQISLASSVTCPGVNGIYSYTINANTLTMTLVSDACVDAGNTPRSTVIAGSWTKL